MKKLLKNGSVSSILIAIVGLVLLLMPSLTNKIIVYGIGIVLLIYGLCRILRYVTTKDAAQALAGHDLSIGLILAVTALFMLIYSSVVIGILPFLFGLFLIYGGARSIQTAFDIRRFRGPRWVVHLVIGIIFAVAGIEAIRDPFSTAQLLTRVVGLCLLLLGIYMFLANRKVNELRAEYMAEENIIDQDSIIG